jgi:hypothetical protein
MEAPQILNTRLDFDAPQVIDVRQVLNAPPAVPTPQVEDARNAAGAPRVVNASERRPTGAVSENHEPVIVPRMSEPPLAMPVADSPRRTSPVSEPLPTIRIHIGRIEVRSAETSSPPAERLRSALPKVSLAEFLKSQARGKS